MSHPGRDVIRLYNINRIEYRRKRWFLRKRNLSIMFFLLKYICLKPLLQGFFLRKETMKRRIDGVNLDH